MSRDDDVPQLAVHVARGIDEVLGPGGLQLHAHQHGEAAADDGRDHRENQVERADVLVVGGEEPPHEEARRVVMMRVAMRARLTVGHDSLPLRSSLLRRRGGNPPIGRFDAQRRLPAARDPPVELILRHGLDHDRHVGVPGPAEFRTLAVIGARPCHLEPGLVDAPRHRVDLHTEGRHRPGMQYVGSGDEEPHLGTDRDDHRRIRGQQPRLAGLQITVCHHDAVEPDFAVVGIFVRPVPLVARRLDRDVGLFRAVQVIEQPERGNRDTDEDDHRHHRPQHLHQRIVRGAARHGVALLAEPPHHVEQQQQNEHRDHRDDHQKQVMECREPLHRRRGSGLKGHLPVPRLRGPNDGRRQPDGAGGECDTEQAHHAHDERHSVGPLPNRLS